MSLLDRFKSFVTGSAVGPSGTTVPGNTTPDADDLPSNLRRALANAHRNPIVFAVVTWLANQISTTPVTMQRTSPDGEIEVVTVHPLLSLLRSPSAFLSGRELRSVAVWDMLIKGQTFWRKDRIRSGPVDSVYFLPAGEVEVKGNREELVTEYLWRPGNMAPVSYVPEEIVHIRLTPDPRDPKNGLPPLVALARALLVENQTGDYTSVFLTEVGTAGGFLMPPGENVLSEEVARETRKYIQNEFRGSKRGTLGVLRAAMNFIRTTIDPKSAGTHEIHDEVVELICSVFGVHPVIMGLGAGTAQARVGAATKELERAAWTNRVIPVQDTISEQIGRQLLPEFVPEAEVAEWGLNWDRSNVYSLQPDLLREAQRWSVLFNSGIATRYDARKEQMLETDDRDKVYKLAAGSVLLAAGELPPVQTQPEPSGASDEETLPNEPEERSLVSKALIRLAETKVALTPDQRALLLAFARDAGALAEQFGQELDAAFEDLGERAVEAFWAVEGGESVRSAGNGLRVKQDPDVTGEVNRILQALTITAWEQGILIPAWDGHTLRTLNLTVGTVNATLGLEVGIPDPVSRNILAQGGSRRGLIDFTAQARQSLFTALEESIALGEGPIALARRIRDQVPAGPFPHAGSKYRAELIARTETAYAQNVSALETYKQADVFVGVVISDGDYDPACAALNGQRVSFQEFDLIGPIEHPQCTRSIAPVRTLE